MKTTKSPEAAAEPADAAGTNGHAKPLPLLIGKKEAARLLSLGVSTFDRYVQCGYLPKPLRFGNVLRWRLDLLQQWLEDGAPRGEPVD